MAGPMNPPQGTGHRRQRGRLFHSWESWLVLTLSLMLTGLAWWLLDDQAQRMAEGRFHGRARDLTATILSRLGTYEEMLRGGVALIDAKGGQVDRTEWRTYIAGLNVGERFPGVQGIGYGKRVKAADLEAHEAAIRGEGFAAYEVTPAGARPEYFPVVYLEPFAGRNLRAFGFDMHAEPMRRDAMERARDCGCAAATGKVRLVQETEEDVQAGFLVYLPVYDQRRPLDTPAHRHEASLGFVYSPFRMGDLMRAVLADDNLRKLEVRIYDGAEPTGGALMFGEADHGDEDFRTLQRLDVFGRTWTLEVASTQIFEDSLAVVAPRAILVAGMIITLLLLAIIDSALTERSHMAELRRSYDAVAKARLEAEEANAAKSRFLAAASHDLRQPLQTLGIYLHLIAEHPESGPMRRLVDAARDGFEATQRLLNSLMDIAMLETGVMRPQMSEVALPPFLARISEDIRVEAAGKGLAFRVSPCDVQVTTDPAMLERILRNLLHNALKYTDHGVIRLACRTRRDSVAIKVQDTGPGIPRDRMHLIFEDFYQIGNPERDRNKGLGLGLATVARLSRLLGIRLRVMSRPGRGAVFVVEIPLETPPTPAKTDRPDTNLAVSVPSPAPGGRGWSEGPDEG